MAVFLVIAITTFALIAGAVWGAYLKLPGPVEGFMVAMAGGALIIALMEEMIRPAAEELSTLTLIASVLIGAGVFTLLDKLVDDRLGQSGGYGLLLAVTLDGIPENLALGTALIVGDALAVASLAGSIFLSNLPEAAGGAQGMIDGGMSIKRAIGL